MMDIVPSHSVPQQSHAAANKKSHGKILTLNWKLPARLRRPIRDELKRQRLAQANTLNFKRRLIYKNDVVNRGAENNTGDVYLKGQPQVSVTVPPAFGSFLKAPRHVTQPRQPKLHSASGASSRPIPRAHQVKRLDVKKVRQGGAAAVRPAAHVKKNPASLANLLQSERDVPYQWRENKQAMAREPIEKAIVEPKRRFAFPIHLSFLPLGLKPDRKTEFFPVETKEEAPTLSAKWGKKKL